MVLKELRKALKTTTGVREEATSEENAPREATEVKERKGAELISEWVSSEGCWCQKYSKYEWDIQNYLKVYILLLEIKPPDYKYTLFTQVFEEQMAYLGAQMFAWLQVPWPTFFVLFGQKSVISLQSVAPTTANNLLCK